MLVSFQEGVLYPEHQRVHCHRHDHHDEDQLCLRVTLKDGQDGLAPCYPLHVIGQLEEEDEELGKQGAHAPDYDLDRPNLNVNVLIWVEIVVFGNDRHRFVRVDSTLKRLWSKMEAEVVIRLV